MRILVCGGREYSDNDFLTRVLNTLHKEYMFTCVINGMARGADSLAREWAIKNFIGKADFPADWDRHGRQAAGPIRNQKMLDDGRPDFLVAFRGNSGTKDMVTRAKKAGIPMIDFNNFF